MKISEQWLREWVNPPVSTSELAEQLTMAGLEVDSVSEAAPMFSGVVIGRVLQVAPHPDADKLRVCQVDVAQGEPLNIVCGAANVREGLMVPAAVVGATLPGDFKIKKAKLRGVESFGMLCSAKELGLAETSEGLLELPDDAPPGTDIREYLSLDDRVIEVDLTPNRGDCLGMMGIAREVGVLNRCAVRLPEAADPVKPAIDDRFPIRVEAPADCPRYLGRVIRGVNPAAVTPLWMQERLRRGGIRSLGPLVDVTNYILLELGQPMHAFDLARLDDAIVVRRARAGETLTLLDGKPLSLEPDTLLISDERKPLALAGIMGGLESGIDDNTRDLFLECAFFTPESIAGRARRYGLQTDSSFRFERGVDPELQHFAMQRATGLLLSIVGGQAGPIIEVKSDEHLPGSQPIGLTADRLTRLLGMEIPGEEVEDILERLGMRLERHLDGWVVEKPSFRFDVSLSADLIEEVGRVYGYNRIPSRKPRGSLGMHPNREDRIELQRLRSALVDRGYQEVITYSFVDPGDQQLIDPEHPAIPLANPISSELAVMRTSLWPGLLRAMVHNQNRQQSRVRIFENGLKFVRQGHEISQEVVLSGAVFGSVVPEQWGSESRKADFFDVKGDLEALLNLGGRAGDYQFLPGRHPALHPGQSAQIQCDGKEIGWVGVLHPELSKKLELSEGVVVFELDFAALSEAQVPSFKGVSRFPSIRRDLAIVVPMNVSAAEVCECSRRAAGGLLKEIRLFDVYTGKGIDSGRKSLALGLILQDSSRTLTDQEVDAAIEGVVAELAREFGALLRE